MDSRLAELDACATAELIRSGEASPREVVEAAIARIEAADGELNAVVHTRFDAALEEADRVDRSLPFAGVPFLFKDIGAPEAGEVSTMGMRLLRDLDFRFPFGSHFAERIRGAGFIPLGRTNCCELGLCPTTEPEAFGPTRNPWDLERTPGGSSGGSAAAVAAGYVAVAHANDGGGSIRIPAAACGLVGLKGTRGRMSWGPVLFEPDLGLAIEGIVSRTVRDTAALLDVYAGNYHGDPYGAPAPVRPWAQEVGAGPGALRIGVCADPPEGALPTDPASARAVELAAAALEELGHSVEPSYPAPFWTEEFRVGFIDWWAAATAATVEAIGTALGRTIGAEDVEPLTWALAERGSALSAPELIACRDRVGTLCRFGGAWWNEHDLLLSPTLQTPARPLGELMSGDPETMLARAFRWTPLTPFANASGQPAISVPVETGDLPTGVQLVAGLGREDRLIAVAAQLEQALPWRRLAPRANRAVI